MLDYCPNPLRIIRVTRQTLKGWRGLSGDDGIPVEQVKLLNPVSKAEEDAIRALANYRVRLVSLSPQITSGLHEKGAKVRGLIDYGLSDPQKWSDVVLKGVQIGVSNPLFKGPTAGSNDVLGMNLVGASVDAVPQTGYLRATDKKSFIDAQALWTDHELLEERLNDPGQVENTRSLLASSLGVDSGEVDEDRIRERLEEQSRFRYAEFFRVAWREMIAPDTERSLYVSIIPPGPTHVDAVRSAILCSARETALLAGFWSSVPLDYYLRVTGVGHFDISNARSSPVGKSGHPLSSSLLLRTLRLNCLTNSYASLWGKLFDYNWAREIWACEWPGLKPLGDVGPDWEYRTPLRDERSRRSALVEIDALVAVWLGMDVEALIAAYRARFPVLNRFEETTWFDANGWKLAGNHRTHGQIQTKQSYKQFLAHKHEGGPVPEGYTEPFYKADREGEYREAHAHFTEIVERAKRDGTWDGEV
jgi:hypothetical protein